MSTSACGYVRIPLTKNQYAIIDKKNEERVNKHLWNAHFDKTTGLFYAHARINGKRVQLANFIMNHDTKDNKFFQIDHINRNSLDNRENNLRKITVNQNMINRRNRNDGIYHNKKRYEYNVTWVENGEGKCKGFNYGKRNRNNRNERKKYKQLAKKYRYDKIRTLPDYIIALRLDQDEDDNSLEDLSNIEISNCLLHINRRINRKVTENISYHTSKRGFSYLEYSSHYLGFNISGKPKEKRVTIGTTKNPTYEIALKNLQKFIKKKEEKSLKL